MNHIRLRTVAAFAWLVGVLPAIGASTVETRQSAILFAPDDFPFGINTESAKPLAKPTEPVPTPGQFNGALFFSGVTTPANPAGLDETRNYVRNADNLDHPRQKDAGGNTTHVLRMQVGAPYMDRHVDFFFADVITPPVVDESGSLLDPSIDPEEYWLPEPHTTDGHANAQYYWSPHAKKPFANQPGRIEVVWKKRVPAETEPADFATNPERYSVEGGLYFRIYSKFYTISLSPAEPGQKMYWTEFGFRRTGRPVNVPGARIGGINVIYNTTFPARVDEQYRDPNEQPRFETGGIEEKRTFWYDRELGQMYAYNREGRVFVEILGEVSENGVTHAHLGVEVVDVIKNPTPADVTVELGEKLTPFTGHDDPELLPEIAGAVVSPFVYRQVLEGTERPNFWAIRETTSPNDLFLHWLQAGVADLRWPDVYGRYKLVWPTDLSKYVHYMRPEVTGETEAEATAVQLPTDNAPQIDYQDALDRPRGRITGDFKFFTHLDRTQPVHRTLLRYVSGPHVAFERVFSWLDIGVQEPQRLFDTFAGFTDQYNRETESFDFNDLPNQPRLVSSTAIIGERINAPEGEIGTNEGESFQAGYIDADDGDLYNVNAYINPYNLQGFTTANLGAIIPINTMPGKEQLEVHWFRDNGADTDLDFDPVLWPSVIARYTLEWPASPSEIILASNDGSGALPSLQAKGSIYFQNDRTQPGFNPNEEHALMLGGQAYALRDDLNVTDAGDTNYTSERFTLLDYTEADGRPSMRVFKVRREAPEQGITFNYAKTAGQVLQAPMPLPVMPRPVPDGEKRSLNLELDAYTLANSAYDGGTGISTLTTDADHLLVPFRKYALQDPSDLSLRRWIAVTAVDYAARTASGVVSAENGYLLTAQGNLVFGLDRPTSLTGGESVAVISAGYQELHWVTVDSVTDTTVTIVNTAPEAVNNATMLLVPDATITADQFATWRVSPELLPDIPATPLGPKNIDIKPRYGKYTFEDRKNNLWVYRGPHSAARAGGLEMQWYYKTQPGFFFPSLALVDQPATGTITPYLRPQNVDGSYQGDPVFATAESQQAFPVVYNPVWPDTTPEMFMAESLMTPKRGLPAMRGNTSLEVFYEQSRAEEVAAPPVSVTLHDATREKEFFFDEVSDSAPNLTKIPDSAMTETTQGKTYFPLLPPHLVQRFFYDPNRGINGALVLAGEFVDEVLGDDYLHLNVLGASDATIVKNLVDGSDENKVKWDAAVDGLATTLETFHENPERAGDYIPNDPLDEVVGAGALAGISDDDTAVDSYSLTAVGPGYGYISIIAGNGEAFTPVSEPVSVLILKVSPTLYRGEIKVVLPPNPLSESLTLQQVTDLAAKTENYVFDWRYSPPVDGFPPAIAYTEDDPGAAWLLIDSADYPEKVRANWGGTADVKTLSDNYIIMRYGIKDVNDSDNDGDTDEILQYTTWTEPALAEGWIKRVLAGINPFNQRVTDLFNNQANTSGSILEQAGRRWEGDVALSLSAINDVGLIEIYETVLRRGRGLSIDADINYGPANDALLLAAGYINDLYMIVGNEAYADAANPTIGIGTSHGALGDVATAQFAFSSQLPSLLEEELALLRGRDDFVLPGVELTPVYNRLIWNYTRGINAGEVIYALNYNIKDEQGEDLDGIINAEDAARMFPQGHGDAYGHYLTAVKGYYKLLIDDDFTWVPRIEAVNVLGKPVTVDYTDERKFAAAAAAVARTGKQVFDLTWRKDFKRGADAGWEHFAETRVNDRRLMPSERHWGADHWASQTGQGTFVNWVVGNALLPDEDPDPTHEGVQKVDRTTVPELNELVTTMTDLQVSLDNANAHMNPLGLTDGSVPFDISPTGMGTGATSHFEQMLTRAKGALKNAVTAFDDAKGVTRMMRSEQDDLVAFQSEVAQEELAYKHRLIELLGTPYPDDIGPGRTYATGYDGPDLLHFAYVDLPELTFGGILDPTETTDFVLDIQDYSDAFGEAGALVENRSEFDFVVSALNDAEYEENVNDSLFIEYRLDSHGFFSKPDTWQSRRASPGEIQQAISAIIKARSLLHQALDDHEDGKYEFDRLMEVLAHADDTDATILGIEHSLEDREAVLLGVEYAAGVIQQVNDLAKDVIENGADAIKETIPENIIAGLSNGGSTGSPAKGAALTAALLATGAIDALLMGVEAATGAAQLEADLANIFVPRNKIVPLENEMGGIADAHELDLALGGLQGGVYTINKRLQDLDDAHRRYRTLLAKADRIQAERQVFRQRAAGIIQGFRTRDAAFRIFRNEKLERYNSMFNLAARYAYLAAQAYDYETGLLHTDEGKAFLERIVASRALGVVKGGEPQFGGSNNGDPGLSSVLAEMSAEWTVLKGRLGINNPDTYSTTTSLRLENYRILPGADGDEIWQDVLQAARKDNILEDADVRRYCMQVDNGDELPVPGFVIEFQTTIAKRLNLFGRQSAAGDHFFSPSSFATKIYSSGVVFDGYKGMDDPDSNASTTDGSSTGEPSVPFLDQDALHATPFIYLIPVGADVMRSPPLGDQSVIRSWNVEDITVPLPFNLGANEFSNSGSLQSSDSLTEPLFGIRKHQAFRPVASTSFFATDNGSLRPSFFTNSRLIGRSVWNTKWKIVIPGETLLSDPEEGMERFIRTVKDIKLHFETYSYSGN